MKGRTIGLTVVMIAAIAIVIWWTRRERAAEQAVLDEANAAAAKQTAGSAGSSATGATSGEKVRKIDPASRTALLDRIASARTARTTGTAATSASSAGPRPALPALAGTISKDDIRAGVRAVIPLLAECYEAALDRLSNKAGKIVVEMHLTGEPEVGTVIEKAEVGGDDHFTRDTELVECFQQTMLSVELPPIEGGGTVDVTYPITFAPN